MDCLFRAYHRDGNVRKDPKAKAIVEALLVKLFGRVVNLTEEQAVLASGTIRRFSLTDVPQLDCSSSPTASGRQPLLRSMSTVYRSIASINGHSLDELKSGMQLDDRQWRSSAAAQALQKYIRRGEEQKALLCMAEMDLFAHAQGGETVRTNMLHRLMIIYLEDVGPADVSMWKGMSDRMERLFELRTNGTEFGLRRELERRLLVDLVATLCRTHHSRTLSHRQAIFRAEHGEEELALLKQWRPRVYDEVKKMGEGLAPKVPGASEAQYALNFVEAIEQKSHAAIYWAFKMYNQPGVGEKTFGNLRKWSYSIVKLIEPFIVDKQLIDLAVTWCKELDGLKEMTLVWMMLIVIVLERIDDPQKDSSIEDEPPSKVDEVYARAIAGMTLPLDDYVLDVHTKAGRKQGAGKRKFVSEGALVVRPFRQRDEYLQAYTHLRLAQSEGVKEAKVTMRKTLDEAHRYRFVVRCQLITSHQHTDTYIAHEWNEVDKEMKERVFVKGPFTGNEAETAVLISQLRQRLGLPYVSSKVVHLIPSKSIVSPLGLRNSATENRPYLFLVTDLIGPLEDDNDVVPTEVRESKLWPKTTVIDWKRIEAFHPLDVNEDSNEVIERWVTCLAFRYVVGVCDNAQRNFVVTKEGVLYGVDEDVMGRDAKLELLSKRAKERIRAVLATKKGPLVDATLWSGAIRALVLEQYVKGMLERLKTCENALRAL